MYKPAELSRMFTPAELCQMFTPAELRQMFTLAELHELSRELRQMRFRCGKNGRKHTTAELRRMHTPAELRQMFTPTELAQMFTTAELGQMFTPAEINELTREDQLLRMRFPKPVKKVKLTEAQKEAMAKVTRDVFGELEDCLSLERGKNSIC